MSQPRLTSGIANIFSGLTEPSDFLTWHDQLPYRIWIHSHKMDDSYRPISVEVQWVGDRPQKVDPSELMARLQVASLYTGNATNASLSPANFRGIALGQLMELHSSAVTEKRMKARAKSSKRVQLVKNLEIEEFPTFWTAATKSWKVKPLKSNDGELGASLRDSIFISYIYAEQVKSGQLRPAKRTAELLNIPTQTVYVAVRTARKKNWLTSTKSAGTSGGELTASGEEAFRKLDGISQYESLFSSLVKRGK